MVRRSPQYAGSSLYKCATCHIWFLTFSNVPRDTWAELVSLAGLGEQGGSVLGEVIRRPWRYLATPRDSPPIGSCWRAETERRRRSRLPHSPFHDTLPWPVLSPSQTRRVGSGKRPPP